VYAAGTVQGTSVQVGNQTAALTSTSTSVFVARLTSAGVCQWLRVVDGQFISPALATDPSTGGVVLAGGYLGTPFFGNTLLPAAVCGLITQAYEQAVRAVDTGRVLLYWHLGRVIPEEEQYGADRTAYGSSLIKGLAAELQPQFGSEFSGR
jgi:hypothetical protein